MVESSEKTTVEPNNTLDSFDYMSLPSGMYGNDEEGYKAVSGDHWQVFDPKSRIISAKVVPNPIQPHYSKAVVHVEGIKPGTFVSTKYFSVLVVPRNTVDDPFKSCRDLYYLLTKQN